MYTQHIYTQENQHDIVNIDATAPRFQGSIVSENQGVKARKKKKYDVEVGGGGEGMGPIGLNSWVYSYKNVDGRADFNLICFCFPIIESRNIFPFVY